jgi:hypothetical protein
MRFSSITRVAALLVGLFGCLAVLSSLFLPLTSAARPAARQAVCTDHFKQISIALENYHRAHGYYPPAYLADSSGKPMHSWRVLILKDLAPDVYAAYDFSEPWNGLNNSKLAAKMPSVFSCSNETANRDVGAPYTNYVVITGPETVFPENRPIKLDDIRSPRNKTILVAESANSRIHWMEPRDLDSTLMGIIPDDPSQPSISSKDPGGPGILLVDGTVRRLREPISPKALKAMTRIAGQSK